MGKLTTPNCTFEGTADECITFYNGALRPALPNPETSILHKASESLIIPEPQAVAQIMTEVTQELQPVTQPTIDPDKSLVNVSGENTVEPSVYIAQAKMYHYDLLLPTNKYKGRIHYLFENKPVCGRNIVGSKLDINKVSENNGFSQSLPCKKCYVFSIVRHGGPRVLLIQAPSSHVLTSPVKPTPEEIKAYLTSHYSSNKGLITLVDKVGYEHFEQLARHVISGDTHEKVGEYHFYNQYGKGDLVDVKVYNMSLNSDNAKYIGGAQVNINTTKATLSELKYKLEDAKTAL